MSGAIHQVDDLVARGLVRPQDAPALDAMTRRYALAITPAMAELMDPADPEDPIARQFVPDLRELDARPEELADPIGDQAHSPLEGIVHRYADRVLLKVLHVCPVYCRFCFRREMVGPGAEQVLSAEKLEAALAYIAGRPDIWEVILTGGDPLALSARRIQQLMQALGQIDHVKVVRIHTRVPAVSPERIDEAMLTALNASGKTVYVALHANHPRELGERAAAALGRLSAAGIALVSQSVLLKGVNDDVAVLAALMRRFVELKVKPYYLHHGDLAPGTSHLRVGLERGRALVEALRASVSGLAQPAYVLDIPGGYGKVSVAPDHLSAAGVRDHRGQIHAYPEQTYLEPASLEPASLEPASLGSAARKPDLPV